MKLNLFPSFPFAFYNIYSPWAIAKLHNSRTSFLSFFAKPSWERKEKSEIPSAMETFFECLVCVRLKKIYVNELPSESSHKKHNRVRSARFFCNFFRLIFRRYKAWNSRVIALEPRYISSHVAILYFTKVFLLLRSNMKNNFCNVNISSWRSTRKMMMKTYGNLKALFFY